MDRAQDALGLIDSLLPRSGWPAYPAEVALFFLSLTPAAASTSSPPPFLGDSQRLSPLSLAPPPALQLSFEEKVNSHSFRWLVLLGWLCKLKTLANANTIRRLARVALPANVRGITPSAHAPSQLLAKQTWPESTAQRPPGHPGACVGRARLLITGARIRRHARTSTSVCSWACLGK